MINRELTAVSVIKPTGKLDEYAQPIYSTDTKVEMTIKLYSHSKVDDVRFNDVQFIGITASKDIAAGDKIEVNNEKFDVLFVIPSCRWQSVLMKRVQ